MTGEDWWLRLGLIVSGAVCVSIIGWVWKLFGSAARKTYVDAIKRELEAEIARQATICSARAELMRAEAIASKASMTEVKDRVNEIATNLRILLPGYREGRQPQPHNDAD
jgi:hypothetical protein